MFPQIDTTAAQGIGDFALRNLGHAINAGQNLIKYGQFHAPAGKPAPAGTALVDMAHNNPYNPARMIDLSGQYKPTAALLPDGSGSGSGTGSPAPSSQSTVTAPSDPNATASTTVDKSNDIAMQNAALGSADDTLNTGLSSIDKALGGIIGQYDTESKANEGNYQAQSDANQNNLQQNKQTALVNANEGRHGLFGTLASLGALNGDGIKLADRAVQNGANEDLAGAANTFATNQNGLDTAIGDFRREDAQRRQEANTAATDAKTNAQNDNAKTKQQLYTNIANDYAAEGDTADAGKFTDMAKSLFPSISKTSLPSTNLAYTGAAFTPATLASYVAGANNMAVSAAPSNGAAVPNLVATNLKRKQ